MSSPHVNGVAFPAKTRIKRLLSGEQLAADLSLLPDQRGVYIAVGRAIIPLLNEQGYYGVASSCHDFIGMDPIAYVGCAFGTSIRQRVGHHLFGDSRKSTLRQSLGVCLAAKLRLKAVGVHGRSGFHFGDGEIRLSAWIQAHLSFTFQISGRPIELERSLMKAHHPPFNIKEREWDPFARQLSAARQAMSRPPEAQDSKPLRDPCDASRVQSLLSPRLDRPQPLRRADHAHR